MCNRNWTSIGIVVLAGCALAHPLGAQVPGPACALTYERADSPWAPYGQPEGDLGRETLTLVTSRYEEDHHA
jgi:hypothetical protein